MRHMKAGRRLGRNATHRLAMFRNLTRSLIEHGRIVTTVAKAKEVRPFVEKLITLAKKGTLHSRRLVKARLGPVASADLLDTKGDPTGDTLLRKLFTEIGPRFADRPGGYTRIIKRHERRLGDAGATAFLELLKEGETKVQRRRTPAAPAAPRLTTTTETSPAPPTPSETPAAPQASAPAEAPVTPPSNEPPPPAAP